MTTGTPLSETQIKGLMANLNPARIAHRTQSGSKLSYLEAWDVRAALIRVFGFGGFSIETLDVKILNESHPKAEGNGKAEWRIDAMARVQLTIPVLGAIYSEAAVSSQAGSTYGDVADFAVKTAVSDAMKRCAINLGTQFGLSLYNNGSHVDIIGVLLDPVQAELLATARRSGAKPSVDPTPEHATKGIGAGDPDAPRDYVAEAEAAESATEAVGIWREAKAAGASPEDLAKITAVGEKLRERERPAGEGAADAAKAALERGFGTPVREIGGGAAGESESER